MFIECAGKVTFNPFSITRKVDKSSPIFFQNACSGKAFKSVFLGIRKSAGNEATGVFFLVFQFKLVAVKTVGYIPNVDQTFGGTFSAKTPAPGRSNPKCVKRSLPWIGKTQHPKVTG